MPHVVTVGPIPNDFLVHLKDAGYTYTTVEKAYSSHDESTLNAHEPPVAVALHGSDAGLESTEEILSLLNTNAILLLFSPSLTLLQVLKSAIAAVIDIPRIKVEDNTPLIVFKTHGIDHFNIVPGFSLLNLESPSANTRQSIFLKFSVKLIENCMRHASDPAVLRRLTNENTLVPPIGIKWCKQKLGYHLVQWDLKDDKLSLFWAVDVYAYATKYPPPKEGHPEDPQRKTVVYTLILHNGNFQYSGMLGMFREFSTSIGDPKGILHQLKQTPAGYSSQMDKTFSYVVDFNEQVTLFMSASLPQDYKLIYQNNYPLNKVKQTSTKPDALTYRFDYISSEGYYGHEWTDLPLNGVTAWQSDMCKPTLDCKYKYKVSILGADKSGDGQKDLPLDLTFVDLDPGPE